MDETLPESRSKRTILRRKYSEDGLADAIIEGGRTYSIDEKLVSDRYNHTLNIELTAKEVTLQRFHNEGFNTPILIRDKTGLGMRIPSQNFTINDVKKLVGSRRPIDVMDCKTQQVSTMTMKEFTTYYLLPTHARQLNVLSLEFSSTRLATYVDPPAVVRQIDWINTSWPAYLKLDQTDGTNLLDTMMYPKVQKYCLMSVGGCYTDFHIDMGGTSVWYHILHGRKIFWLIRPTPGNLKAYETWTRSGTQDHTFFGDLVDECQRIVLDAGMTFFIPSGWIHAVKTPIDSLVFGGNFLHSYSIEMQLACFNIENSTKVPTRFRYPYFKEIHWFTLSTYVSRLTGHDATADKYQVSKKSSLESIRPIVLPVTPPPENNNTDCLNNIFDKMDATKKTIMKSELPILKLKRVTCEFKSPEKMKGDDSYINLSPYEIRGLAAILNWLGGLPDNRLSVPDQILDSSILLDNIRDILVTHGQDVVSDNCVALMASESGHSISAQKSLSEHKIRKRLRSGPDSKKLENKHKPYAITVRRTRCKQCEPCTRLDCVECKHCVDMKKHGGPGIMKQSCISRQCIMPLLPKNTRCNLCDGDKSVNIRTLMEFYVPESNSSIMECARCGEMVHPACFQSNYSANYPLKLAVVNEDVASTWDCARCMFESASKHEDQENESEKPAKHFKTSPTDQSRFDDTNTTSADCKENVETFVLDLSKKPRSLDFKAKQQSRQTDIGVNGTLYSDSFKKHAMNMNPMTPILISSRRGKINAPSRLDL